MRSRQIYSKIDCDLYDDKVLMLTDTDTWQWQISDNTLLERFISALIAFLRQMQNFPL